jgi:class 3 adenylate cyclase/tetratricopeptide (TPR) repeat protein
VTSKVLTVLLTDVVASTELHVARGDAQAMAILARYHEVVGICVAEHGGRVIKGLGDGQLIAFESPRRAVQCALAIMRAVADDAERDRGSAVRVRAGLHTGEVLEAHGELHGSAVAAATRICARAQGGEVLVSDVVRQLCGTLGPDAVFSDRGRFSLKGFPERWQLFSVVPEAKVRSRTGGLTPFVGREHPRALLRDRLDAAMDGSGSLVMIGGEPGIGKTRLCEVVAAEARQRGLGVYTGHCYETEGDLPYMPWVEMLEEAARAFDPAELLQILGEHAPTLAQIAPELRRLVPGIPPLVELPVGQQRWHLFNSVREFFGAVTGARRPLLLVLEDLHWADESTLQLLEQLVTWLVGLPMLVLGTYRDLEAEVSQRLSQSLAGFVRRPEARIISLPSHSATEVGDLLLALSGHPPPTEVVDAIFAESEGNALFVEEVFRHLSDSGRLLDERGAFRPDLRIDELDVPANLRLVIDWRLGRLSESTRRMLGLAAVVGRKFTHDVLQAVGGLESVELLDAIEAAEHAQVIVEESARGAAGYCFAHELFRQTLLAGVSTPRRQRYHLQVADALERLRDGAPELAAAEIAHHLLQSGVADPARTARHLALAGDLAQGAAAFEEALRAYEQALELPSIAVPARADLLLRLARSRESLGHWEEAIAAWSEALALLEDMAETKRAAELCWDMVAHLMWAYRFSDALEIAERGLRAAGEGPERAPLLAIAALALVCSGRYQEAAAHMTDGARRAEVEGDPRALALVWECEASYHGLLMRLPETIDRARRAAGVLREQDRSWHLVTALAYLNTGLALRGEFAEAQRTFAELEPSAERVGHLAAAGVGRRNQFVVKVAVEADLDDLDAWTRMPLTGARTPDSLAWQAYARSLAGVVGFWRGDWDAARTHMQEGVRLAGSYWAPAQHGVLLVLDAYSGDHEAVRARLDGLEPGLPRQGRDNLLPLWNLGVMAAEAAGVLGDAELSLRLFPLVVEALSQGAIVRQPDGRLLETCAAVAAAAAGLADAAEDHFELSLRQARELPHRIEAPHVRHLYARFLLDRDRPGDIDRATGLLVDAREAYAKLGMPRHEALVRDLIEGPLDAVPATAVPARRRTQPTSRRCRR